MTMKFDINNITKAFRDIVPLSDLGPAAFFGMLYGGKSLDEVAKEEADREADLMTEGDPYFDISGPPGDDDLDKALYQLKNPNAIITPWGPTLSTEAVDDILDGYPGALEIGDLDPEEQGTLMGEADDLWDMYGNDLDSILGEAEDFAMAEGIPPTEAGNQMVDQILNSIPLGLAGGQFGFGGDIGAEPPTEDTFDSVGNWDAAAGPPLVGTNIGDPRTDTRDPVQIEMDKLLIPDTDDNYFATPEEILESINDWFNSGELKEADEKLFFQRHPELSFLAARRDPFAARRDSAEVETPFIGTTGETDGGIRLEGDAGYTPAQAGIPRTDGGIRLEGDPDYTDSGDTEEEMSKILHGTKEDEINQQIQLSMRRMFDMVLNQIPGHGGYPISANIHGDTKINLYNQIEMLFFLHKGEEIFKDKAGLVDDPTMFGDFAYEYLIDEQARRRYEEGPEFREKAEKLAEYFNPMATASLDRRPPTIGAGRDPRLATERITHSYAKYADSMFGDDGATNAIRRREYLLKTSRTGSGYADSPGNLYVAGTLNYLKNWGYPWQSNFSRLISQGRSSSVADQAPSRNGATGSGTGYPFGRPGETLGDQVPWEFRGRTGYDQADIDAMLGVPPPPPTPQVVSSGQPTVDQQTDTQAGPPGLHPDDIDQILNGNSTGPTTPLTPTDRLALEGYGPPPEIPYDVAEIMAWLEMEGKQDPYFDSADHPGQSGLLWR